MSQVVDELFDFRQCDLYLRDEDGLTGLRFAELVGRYRTARPLGRVRPGGEIELNPPPGTVVEAGDRLIVLAQDRGELTVDTSPAPVPQTHRAGRAAADRVAPEHVLTVGWSEFGAQLLGHWALHSNPASTVEIAADDVHGEILAAIDALGVGGRAILGHDDPIERIAHPAGRPNVDTVVFLADHELDRHEADVRVLLDLAALRSAVPAAALPRLVVELRDVDSIALVQLPGADDYVVSEAIASRFIAQLAEQPERRAVFLELYHPSTSTLRIDDVDELGLVGEFEVRHTLGGRVRAGPDRDRLATLGRPRRRVRAERPGDGSGRTPARGSARLGRLGPGGRGTGRAGVSAVGEHVDGDGDRQNGRRVGDVADLDAPISAVVTSARRSPTSIVIWSRTATFFPADAQLQPDASAGRVECEIAGRRRPLTA